MPSANWEFAFVLPNLVLPIDNSDSNPGAHPDGISIAPEWMTILPGSHAAVGHLRSNVPAVDQILSSFFDEYGKSYEPAVLLVRRDAVAALRHDLEAIVAFRNAVAMSVVLRARAAMIANDAAPDASWSDTFDFHPAKVGRGDRMVLQSPAVVSLVSTTARLRLTHSPYVKIAGRRLWADRYLMRALGRAWQRRFTPQPRANSFSWRAFRSLEVAYQASAVGAKNEASLHEYGTQIGLWVSACEILAWADSGRANLPAVIDLLARYPGDPPTMRKRYRATFWGRVHRLSAPQRAYSYMYAARNQFLHGEKVGVNALWTRSRSAAASLPAIAALVYRTALVAYLTKRYPVDGPLHLERDLMLELFDHDEYHRAFAEAFGYDR